MHGGVRACRVRCVFLASRSVRGPVTLPDRRHDFRSLPVWQLPRFRSRRPRAGVRAQLQRRRPERRRRQRGRRDDDRRDGRAPAAGAHRHPDARHRRGVRPPPARAGDGRRAGAQHPRGRDRRRVEGRLPRQRRGRRGRRRDPVGLPRRAARGLHAGARVDGRRRAAGLPRRVPRARAAGHRGAGGQPQDADRLPAARVGQRTATVGARARGGRRRTRHALRARDRHRAAVEGQRAVHRQRARVAAGRDHG